ncbi:hypothetical protein C0R09_18430 [Brevibacillus laterosporus]|uniref:hypothetical protein n=1 Tax=Brevibacillus laterosporus TaxID=1465 RepID=UPI000C7580F7|nr:hypothetical protein [Brevibacillus laterosporus]AUM66335.1 hypothetical protein C0R09_18430 [Brevibacillus laterosporus]
MEGISQEDYIQSLESLLIFMWDVYQTNHDKFFQMMVSKENDAYMKLSTVQGSHHRFAVKDISQLEFQQPKLDIRVVFEEMQRRRGETV